MASALVMYLTLVFYVVQSLELRMIHRDSILSPLYPGNLTAEEHMHRLYNYTILRTQMIEARMSSPVINYNTTHVQPRVELVSALYVLEVGIGTPRHTHEYRKARYLMMDTASSFVWLQCQPCINCWSPHDMVFDPRSSQSFALIPCDHPLCDLRNPIMYQCINRQCHYIYKYPQPALTKGVLATETLALASNHGGFEFVHNFAFGCSHDNENFKGFGVLVSGIAGLGKKSTSFIRQMNEVQAHSKFAYCLQKENNHPSVLKLGENAILHGPNVKRVPIVNVHSDIDYFVTLVDVSVANHRIGFPPGTFRVRFEHGLLKGGFIIDSGSTYATFSIGGPYERVRDTFKEYFLQFRLTRHHRRDFEECYKIPHQGFNAYPNMTFHFENGNDFVAPPENMVSILTQRYFCVAIAKSETVNTLGAYQQQNYWMSFDIQSNTLSYIRADCSRDAQ